MAVRSNEDCDTAPDISYNAQKKCIDVGNLHGGSCGYMELKPEEETAGPVAVAPAD